VRDSSIRAYDAKRWRPHLVCVAGRPQGWPAGHDHGAKPATGIAPARAVTVATGPTAETVISTLFKSKQKLLTITIKVQLIPLF
jgi:hypothetical protein